MKKGILIIAFIFASIMLCSVGVAYAFEMDPETVIYGSRYSHHYNFEPNNDYVHFIELQHDTSEQLYDAYFTYKKVTSGARKTATTRIESYNNISIAHTTAYIQNRSGTASKFEENTVNDLTSNAYDTNFCQVSATINNALVFNFRQTQHSGEIVYEESGANLNNPDIYCYADYYA